MNSYILLRNKIESKPLSLEELQAMGLRSTDLIWVECQSWDWQHPQEIPELKMLLEGKTPPIPAVKSPVIAKDPVKTVDKTSTKEQVKPKMTLRVAQTIFPDEQAFTAPAPASIQDKEADSYTPLPEKITAIPVPDLEEDMYKYGGIGAAPGSIKEEPVVTKQEDHSTLNEDHSNKIKQDDEATLNTKYSRSLDEIKELYVRNLAEQGRLGKTKKRILVLPGNLKKIAVYIGFAAAGAILMLLLRNTGSKKNIAAVPVAQSPTSKTADQTTGSEDAVILPEQPDQSVLAVNNDPAPANVEENRQVVENDPPAREAKPVTAAVIPAPEERKQVDRDETSKQVINENKPAVADKPREKTRTASDLSSMVSVSANNYETGSFGGIRNLEMTVKNDSKYLLDEVKVELKYLNLDNIVVNTDHISFRSVQPGEPETIAVKKSRRGLKVKYRIVKIESRDANNSTASF